MGVCTYTKGYYRNHASVTSSVIAGMGGTILLGSKNLTAAQAQDILNATPGQSGNVSWGPTTCCSTFPSRCSPQS